MVSGLYQNKNQGILSSFLKVHLHQSKRQVSSLQKCKENGVKGDEKE